MDLSFLGDGKYQAMAVRDNPSDPAAEKIDRAAFQRGDPLAIALRAGGGFVARFSR
ncbi:MAG: glycoside hydrolase family 97 C-terminal domain-containing protein [Bryobacteraceae bacterium]